VSVTLALALIQIVTFSSVIQAQPLAVTMGAAIFLGEKVGWRRWASILIGFLGVLVVLRPWTSSFDIAALWALAGVLGMTTRDLATRALPREVPTSFAATWALLAVMVVAAMLIPVTGGWRAPDAITTAYIIGMILSGALAYLSITLAMRVGEVSAIASFRYSRIVFAMLIGYVVFAERPDLWVWVGTAIIVLSGLYTLMRESRPA
jgi:drug/metabolite transporter (DMT)-like permease